MASSEITVRLSRETESFLTEMTKAITQATSTFRQPPGTVPARTPGNLEPVTIGSPGGVKVLWVDDIGESHWPKAGVDCSARGWRQVWARKP